MNILHLAFQLGISKKLPRTGWVLNGIKNPESVAEHCFRVIVLTMALAEVLDLNQQKLIKMSVIHDIGETSTGDLVVEHGKEINHRKRKVKESMEKDAIRHILYGYKEDYAKLFQEMIDRKTPEAIAFWQIDKLEMAIQAYEYEKEQKVDLSQFFVSSDAQIKHPVIRKAFDDLMKMRVNLKK